MGRGDRGPAEPKLRVPARRGFDLRSPVSLVAGADGTGAEGAPRIAVSPHRRRPQPRSIGKSAVNYFLGMATCKLFAAKLLDAPWLLHLDVFRPTLNRFLTGRSRPDMLGQTQSGQWLAFESKAGPACWPPMRKTKPRSRPNAARGSTASPSSIILAESCTSRTTRFSSSGAIRAARPGRDKGNRIDRHG